MEEEDVKKQEGKNKKRDEHAKAMWNSEMWTKSEATGKKAKRDGVRLRNKG